MDLSVIIPVHNLENYITPMLVSLSLQLLDEYKVELIFVCDGCTDKTEELIEKFNFRAPYKKISIIKCNHLFCGLARNEGMKVAEGKIIMFLDGDDWLTDPFVFFKVLQVFDVHPEYSIIHFKYEAPGFHAYGHPSMVWQYAYQRELIGDTVFPAEHPNEDFKFNTEISKKIGGFNKIPLLPETLYHYNFMRENSNMQQLYKKGRIDP